PWLSGLLALLLFWRVTGRFASGLPLLAGVAIFAVSPALIWYGVSVKQYGMDVTGALLLVWLGLRFLEGHNRLLDAAVAGGAGAAAIFSSHPAVVTAFVIGCILVLNWSRERPRVLAPLSALAGTWGIAAITATVAAMGLHSSATDEFMRAFWREGFPPTV